MHDSGGIKEGRIGAGGDNSYSMQACTLTNHGGRHLHTAAMGPHTQRRSIQQSSNILCDQIMSLKLLKIIGINIYWEEP